MGIQDLGAWKFTRLKHLTNNFITVRNGSYSALYLLNITDVLLLSLQLIVILAYIQLAATCVQLATYILCSKILIS